MFRSIAVTAILSLALAAQANDGVELSLRTKALVSASSAGIVVKHADAPFAVGRDPLPQLMRIDEARHLGPRAACEMTSKDLCYDLADARIVYRPARNYMPSVQGLKPENVSLRHNRVVFKYSFR
jgi:hypothetical protein